MSTCDPSSWLNCFLCYWIITKAAPVGKPQKCVAQHRLQPSWITWALSLFDFAQIRPREGSVARKCATGDGLLFRSLKLYRTPYNVYRPEWRQFFQAPLSLEIRFFPLSKEHVYLNDVSWRDLFQWNSAVCACKGMHSLWRIIIVFQHYVQAIAASGLVLEFTLNVVFFLWKFWLDED